MIVHLQTVVQTMFVEIDADGNVVKKTPVNLEIPKIDDGLFVEAARTLAKYKDELAAAEAATKTQG